MINRFSRIILDYLLQSKVIEDSEDEKEYYQYGIEITVSSILNVVLILLIGVIFRSVIESIFFLVLFIPIRQFAGGFHADTYFKCNMFFGILYTMVLWLTNMTYSFLTTYFVILVSLVCVALIFYMCPIEHINKPIPKERRKIHKFIATLLGFIYGISATILTSFLNRYGALTLYVLSLVTVLIIVAKVSKKFDMRGCKNEK